MRALTPQIAGAMLPSNNHGRTTWRLHGATSSRQLRSVGIGRPALWGLIDGGSLGVKSVYAQLAFELKSTLLMSGVAKVSELNRDNLARI